jgi:hypothetical protein
MLDKSAVLLQHNATVRQLGVPEPLPGVRPVWILKAKSIAHSVIGKDELSALAAKWVSGRIVYRPTIDLACAAFNVSRPRVTEVLMRMEAAPFSLPLGLLESGWNKSTAVERDAFCFAHEEEIWSVLERICDRR